MNRKLNNYELNNYKQENKASAHWKTLKKKGFNLLDKFIEWNWKFLSNYEEFP